MPGRVNEADTEAETTGNDPELVIRPKTGREAGTCRVRGRMLERWSERATVARVERAVIERGIGPGVFCSRQRWAGGTAGRVERKRA